MSGSGQGSADSGAKQPVAKPGSSPLGTRLGHKLTSADQTIPALLPSTLKDDFLNLLLKPPPQTVG